MQVIQVAVGVCTLKYVLQKQFHLARPLRHAVVPVAVGVPTYVEYTPQVAEVAEKDTHLTSRYAYDVQTYILLKKGCCPHINNVGAGCPSAPCACCAHHTTRQAPTKSRDIIWLRLRQVKLYTLTSLRNGHLLTRSAATAPAAATTTVGIVYAHFV
jgi:hypothetical protein